MEDPDGPGTSQDQVLSVSNLQKFNQAIAEEDQETVKKILEHLTANKLVVPSVLASLPKLTETGKMVDTGSAGTLSGEKEENQTIPSNMATDASSKIVIPMRLVAGRPADDTDMDSNSGDSDEDYHGTSESSPERSTKSMSVKTEEEDEDEVDEEEKEKMDDGEVETHDEETSSEEMPPVDDKKVDDSETDGAIYNNSNKTNISNKTVEDNDNIAPNNTVIAENKNNNNPLTNKNNCTNEVIKNTMNNLNNKNTNMNRKNINSTRRSNSTNININSEQIKSISNNLSKLAENDTDIKKSAVIPFDIDAARMLNIVDEKDKKLYDNQDVFGNDPSNNTDPISDDASKGGTSPTANSTNSQDDRSKYFTIIHDLPRDGPCKKCPKIQLPDFKEWWKVQQNLAPRSRHSLRIGLVALGSALLLLIIFLLARLPHTGSDVSQPTMYDLPADDAFRPLHVGDQPAVYDSHQVQDLQDLPPLPQVDHPDVVGGGDILRLHPHAPLPDPDVNMRALARRKGVGLHPLFDVPVSDTYLHMENVRKQRMQKMRALAGNGTSVKTVLQKVQETVDAERKEMQDKEKKLWDSGETPLRILLVSTWRSGSTFLGQVLQEHPGVFQHYEPFSYLGVRQIRSGTEAFQSQQFLHRLLECRFQGQDEYLNYTKMNPVDMSGHNKRIWKACNNLNRVDICSNATFLTEACNMFPIQLVKSVRLRLNLTQLFLGETRLNAKVVFLVRDPRATISSRKSSVGWCDSSPDCSSPEVLCSDLKEDLKVSAALERLYPNSFIMIRYEDLANDPQNVIKKLLTFLGMEFSSELSEFVAQHTESDVERPWSIARKSAARVSRWKEQLKSEEIENIQKICKPVIEKLGYEIEERK